MPMHSRAGHAGGIMPGVMIRIIALLTFMALLGTQAVPVSALGAQDVELDRQVVAEINAARTRPQAYIQGLIAYRATIRDGYAFKTMQGQYGPYTARVRLKEGVGGVDKAIAFLQRQRPVAPVAGDTLLRNAARRFAEDQAETGVWGHTAADGSDLAARIARDGTRRIANAETIMYGKSTAHDIVMHLIIDDGVRDRSHRDVIFDGSLTLVGTACRPHPKWTICVSEYSSNESDAVRQRYRSPR